MANSTSSTIMRVKAGPDIALRELAEVLKKCHCSFPSCTTRPVKFSETSVPCSPHEAA
ncbi:MAG: hypothetical protein OXH94_16370 [Rhodospirillales bacterium]|nr:hypothetical protein [Rhodospirillales bacterium]